MIFLFYNEKTQVKNIKTEERPIISFFDSIMYEITEKRIEQVIQSKKTLIYNNRDELYDATFIVKSDKNNNEVTNTISALNILKFENNIYLDKNVYLQLSNKFNIRTEQLEYNLKSQIAKNDESFEAILQENSFSGTNLYLDSNRNKIKAKNTKFKIKVKDD
jgi:hypothetical protein